MKKHDDGWIRKDFGRWLPNYICPKCKIESLYEILSKMKHCPSCGYKFNIILDKNDMEHRRSKNG